ncbi:39S ribosomal protein L33, mitochondrial isoform X4 [Canis lupus dingo]|uniref:39S ribosomal protein L33, mitochondrial isoform X4 n=1 Tax=Canis lupus dingo TaxID=286419 RepID=UPI0020C268F6|nr:39S ribosomal protein L33, mitochondrial isoform X4 [Canis lupus dingo]
MFLSAVTCEWGWRRRQGLRRGRELPRASQRKKKLENSNAAFAYNPRHITDHKTRYFGLKLMKNITILVKMLSQAGTGYSFNTKRSRLREKLTLLHYDPIGFSGLWD